MKPATNDNVMNELERLLKNHHKARIEGVCVGCGRKGAWSGYCYLDDHDGFKLSGAATWPRYPYWREQMPHQIEFMIVCPVCAIRWPNVEIETTFQMSLFSYVEDARTQVRTQATHTLTNDSILSGVGEGL